MAANETHIIVFFLQFLHWFFSSYFPLGQIIVTENTTQKTQNGGNPLISKKLRLVKYYSIWPEFPWFWTGPSVAMPPPPPLSLPKSAPAAPAWETWILWKKWRANTKLKRTKNTFGRDLLDPPNFGSKQKIDVCLPPQKIHFFGCFQIPNHPPQVIWLELSPCGKVKVPSAPAGQDS